MNLCSSFPSLCNDALEAVCLLPPHGYKVALLPICRCTRISLGLALGKQQGWLSISRQPRLPRWPESSKSFSRSSLTWEQAFRGSGEAATWDSSVWTLMGVSVRREVVLVRLPLNHHQFLPCDGEEKTLARKGCQLHVVFFMSSCTTSRVFPYPDAAGILWKMTKYNLGIFIQEEEKVTLPWKLFQIAIDTLTCLQCVAKHEILSIGSFLGVWFLLQHSPAQLFPVIPC